MKYNWSIIGHEKQLDQIESDIVSGNIAHAYLLAGPNSVGKNTVAKKMAGILQCENDYCHTCSTCIQVEHDSHLDTVLVKDNKESIKIEHVRKIIERTNMTGQSKYKVFIIQGVERMTPSAANSLLKTLEEPPSDTIFILTTNSLRSLLPTIISRVRVVKFNHVSVNYLEEKIKSLYPNSDAETITKVSVFSLGKTGKALHLMENPESLANHLKVYRDIQNFMVNKSVVDRFSYVSDMVDDKKSVEIFLNMLTHVLRSHVLEGNNIDKNINTLSIIDETGILLKKNINARLVLENLMLSI